MQVLSNLSAKQTGLILVFVPILIELVFVGIIANEILVTGKNFERVHHVKNTLLALHYSQELLLQSFFIIVDKSKSKRAEREEQMQRILDTFRKPEDWGSITAETNPELKDVLERSAELRKANLAIGEQIGFHGDYLRRVGISSRQQNQVLASSAMENQKVAEDLLRIETSLIKNEPEELANLRLTFIGTILFGFLLNLIVSISLLKILIGNLRSRLSYVTDRAQLLALGQPLSKGLSGKNELAEVDRIITEASNALAQFRWTESAVLDNAADVICSLDEKMRFNTVGASSAKVWGHQPEDLVRKSVMTMVTPETAEFTRSSLEKIREETREGTFENALRIQNGIVKDAMWTVTWSPEKQNYYCVINDVTDIRNVDRMKKRFMAMVSHDIRSPLTSIAIILATIAAGKRGDLPAGVFTEIERANASSQRLMALVNDFLELEKLEAHKFSLDLGAVAASEVCNVAKDSLAGLAQSAKVNISSPRGDAILIADERRIVQVLINLLSNAIKFSPQNSTIHISIETVEKMALIKVMDEGPGIAPEEQHVIFDKFQQTRLKSKLNIKSTGLGLAIVKNIVEAHGGRVGVTSETSAGSTFWITIPLFADEEVSLP